MTHTWMFPLPNWFLVVMLQRQMQGFIRTSDKARHRFMLQMMENDVLERQPDVDGLHVAADTFILSLGGQIRPIDNSSEEESDEEDIPDGNTLSAHSKPSEMSQRMTDVLAKLSARKAMLQAALPRSHRFFATCDKFDEWLTAAEKALVSADPLSLEKGKLQEQLQDQQVCPFWCFCCFECICDFWYWFLFLCLLAVWLIVAWFHCFLFIKCIL